MILLNNVVPQERTLIFTKVCNLHANPGSEVNPTNLFK